jgi:ABC-type transport system involved in multi-copper enzyme maturation permease subunit
MRLMGVELGSVLSVARFEGARSLSPGRIAVWVVLFLFPVAIVSLLKSIAPAPPRPEAWTLVIFGLTQVVGILGVLLWATPAIQVELENRTWIFTASRPLGRRSLLLGRYVVAVLWSLAAAATSIVLCVLIVRPTPFLVSLLSLLSLSAVSCAAFGALYSLLAVLFPKRAMVVAVVFTLVFEFLVAFVPAIINQLTIQFRLRCLIVRWIGLDLEVRTNAPPMMFSEAPSWQHLLVLAAYCVGLLTVAVYILEQRELATADD